MGQTHHSLQSRLQGRADIVRSNSKPVYGSLRPVVLNGFDQIHRNQHQFPGKPAIPETPNLHRMLKHTHNQ